MERRRKSLPVSSSTFIDSWDLENVKFLRKLSPPAILAFKDPSKDHDLGDIGDIRGYPVSRELYSEGLENEEQFLHYDETVIFSVSPKSEAYTETNSAFDEESGVHSDSQEIIEAKCEKIPNLTYDPSLESCCSQDVVTIRNESVLANRISPDSEILLPMLSSDGYETASSTGSSIDETAVVHTDESEEHRLEDASFRKASLITERKESIIGRPHSTCPYCGELISLTSNFFQDQIVNDDVELIEPELSQPEEQNLSPLPYYVRLRKNLYLPGINSPQRIGPPKNFSVDQQGQLFIDYTANWEGLEKYIQNLKH